MELDFSQMALEVSHHGYLLVTHLITQEQQQHTRTLLSYIFPRLLIHECDAVIKSIQGEFILGEWFHIDDLGMFQHRIKRNSIQLLLQKAHHAWKHGIF